MRTLNITPEASYGYAIVKHRPEGRSREGGPEFAPDIAPMQNPRANGFPGPNDNGEGIEIPVMKNWWSYLKKINSEKGFQYNQSVGALWMNDRNWNNEIPGVTTGMSVSHIGCGNFVAYDRETPTHIHLVAYDYDMDTSMLNPLINNWHKDSTRFWKACAISSNGKIINVANIDVYFPLIKGRLDVWMYKKDVELLPRGPSYFFRGCDVYDGVTPLLTVLGGQRTFHTSWRINTLGVIPASKGV